MEKKLTWAEIKKLYDQEWVEIIDYEWPLSKAAPSAGVVRVHARTRKEFDRLIMLDSPKDSAFVFVGAPENPAPGVIPSMNLRRLVNVSK
jgi:hypothetical protein